MQRHEFPQSSNIRSVTLDEATGIVEVEFKKDRRRYGGFTATEFADWVAAKSPGGWFADNVRKKPQAHPEVVEDRAVLAVAEESTIAPMPDGWRDLQPNSFRNPAEIFEPAPEPRVSRTDRDMGEPSPPVSHAEAQPHYKTALARARASRK